MGLFHTGERPQWSLFVKSPIRVFLLRWILLGLSSKSSRSCSLMTGGMMLVCIGTCGVAKPCGFLMNTDPSSPLRSEEILAWGVGKLYQQFSNSCKLNWKITKKTVKKSGRNCVGNGRTWAGNGRI